LAFAWICSGPRRRDGGISTDAVDVAPRPSIIDLDIAAYARSPAVLPKIIKQRGNFSLPERIVLKPRDHHADATLELLRAHCEGPRRRGAQKGDELASFH
jgi:hypothetical protein